MPSLPPGPTLDARAWFPLVYDAIFSSGVNGRVRSPAGYLPGIRQAARATRSTAGSAPVEHLDHGRAHGARPLIRRSSGNGQPENFLYGAGTGCDAHVA